MIVELMQGVALVAITVVVHAAVLSWVLWRLHRRIWRLHRPMPTAAFLLHDWAVFVYTATACVFAHLIEIGIWTLFYLWEGTMDSLDVAYFSAVTYATIGYGDITPPVHLRLISAMEGLTGILMCAWSGGFFFGVVTRVWDRRIAPTGS